MSGGVDSSVAALLLKQQGYRVVGVYMKNWSKSLPGFPCPWKEDYQDAKRVAVQLGIEFKQFDFEKQYFDKVVKYMLEGFEAGITPNPDVMCNQEIKFKLFLETCLEQGADYIATGHYAQVKHLAATPAVSAEPNTLRGSRRSALSESPVLAHRIGKYGSLHASTHPSSSSEPNTSQAQLLMAKDKNKDQTYFLYRISEEALKKTLFPLGELTKPQIRALAAKHQLVTATKKESMGICFVGKVGIKEFLSQYVKTKPGQVLDQQGKIIGEHDGAIFYTIGQRHGLNLGGSPNHAERGTSLPYYVTGKDMNKNEVYVTTDLSDEKLWKSELKLASCHWINGLPKPLKNVQVRTRHRGELIKAKLSVGSNDTATIQLSDPVRAVTPGQSAVLYSGEQCLGGGVIA